MEIRFCAFLCQELKKSVEFHTKTALSVENTGTYLKYFGCKRDTVYVKNLLVGVKIRWKKLIRKVDEAGRLLQQALREVKRVTSMTSFLLYCIILLYSASRGAHQHCDYERSITSPSSFIQTWDLHCCQSKFRLCLL